MLKNLASIVVCLLFTAGLLAQEKIKGNRNVTIEEFSVDAFNKIMLSEGFDIVLLEKDEAGVKIETDENLHEIIEFSVVDSVLSFQTNAKIVSSKKLEIKVFYTSDLMEIELLENAEISALTSLDNSELSLITRDNSRAYLNIKSSMFSFNANGRSKSRLNIESNEVHLELNDNSNLEALIVADSIQANMFMHSKATVEGDTNELNINTISSSDFIGKKLTAKTCKINAEDNSDVETNVSESIILNLSGNSDVILYGNAKINLETFTGTATLQKKEL